MALDRWSDAQLDELQRMTLGLNFMDALQTPLGAERAAGIITVDILLKQRDKAGLLNAFIGPESGLELVNVPKPALNAMALLVPRGWYYLEQLNYARAFQDFALPGVDRTKRIFSPSITDRNEAQLDRLISGRNAILKHYFFAKLLMPAAGKVHRRTAHAQTGAHQAAIACALERYRHAHGHYPAELALLKPQFMQTVPHDVVGGKPLHYKSPKPIVLYSIGWDEKDNAGIRGETLWAEGGDWVWTYPAN